MESRISRFRLVILLPLLMAMLAISCSPDAVQPREDKFSEGSAFLADTNIHQPPDPKCGFDLWTPMVFNYGNQQIAIGQAEIVNGLDFLHVIVIPISGLSIKEVALWRGNHTVFCGGVWANTPQCKPPVNGNNVTDPTQFPYYQIYNPPTNPGGFRIPLDQIYEANSFVIWSLFIAVDQYGNPIFNQVVWAQGKSLLNGGEKIDYILKKCPQQTCEPWIDGDPSCKCQVPSLGWNDDLSDFDCTNGNGQQKVNVCHLPPGNPENMQLICIATTALPAHIVDFKPADNPCMGHHSGCHLGPCDPCGPGSSGDSRDAAKAYFDSYGCTGSAYGGNGNNE